MVFFRSNFWEFAGISSSAQTLSVLLRDAATFSAGTLTGAFTVGVGGGGRALSEMGGKPSPAPKTLNPIKILEHAVNNVYDPKLGPPGLGWMSTAPTPASGGAATMFISGGSAALVGPDGE